MKQRMKVTVDGTLYTVDYWGGGPGSHWEPPEGPEVSVLSPVLPSMTEEEWDKLGRKLLAACTEDWYD